MNVSPVRRTAYLALIFGIALILLRPPHLNATGAPQNDPKTIANQPIQRALEDNDAVDIPDMVYAPDAAPMPLTELPPARTVVTDTEDWREGPVIIVTNTNEELNGDHWRPDRLIANPGPDGISFNEAINAANSSFAAPDQHETITFDPSLMGTVITTSIQLAVVRDGLTIDGDINDDGVPDITIDGQGQLLGGLWINGASNIIVEGMHFRNFGHAEMMASGITISYNEEQVDYREMENITLRNNLITDVSEVGIDLSIPDRTHAWIRNVEIIGNTFQDTRTGLHVWPGLGLGTSDNEISHVKIISNTLLGGAGDTIGITIRGAGMSDTGNSHRNLVDDVEIRANTITSYTNIAILMDAANRTNCNDNVISNVVIAQNVMDSEPMGMELVATGQSGNESSGNVITGVAIVDNVLTNGGIQLVGTQAYLASNNTVHDVVVERNHITNCANAGIIAYPGAYSSMFDNEVRDVIIRNNYVNGCTGVGILLDCPNDTCSQGNRISDIDILNNTLVNNGFASPGIPSASWTGGLRIDTDGIVNAITNITISNTILWSNSFGDALVGPFDLAEVVVAHSVISDTRFTGNNGNFYQDPQFTTPGSGDYRLQATSPCIDAGDATHTLTGPQDLDRAKRIWDGDGNGSAIADCGAYEYGAPLMQEMAVQGKSLEIPDGDVLPTAWDGTYFGSLRVTGEKTTHTFAIRNTGGLTLTLTGTPRVAVTGTNTSDFTVVTQPASSLASGAVTTFTVAFNPTARGLRSATFSIDNDDLDKHPYTFAVQGFGLTPEIRIEGNEIEITDGDTGPSETDGTDFGVVSTGGQTAGRMFVLMNTGTTTLTLTGDPAVTITGPHAADFTVTTQPSTTLAPQVHRYPVLPWPAFNITFQPQDAGLRTATVSIASDDLDENPYTFAIQGAGDDRPMVAFTAPSFRVPEAIGTAFITVTLSPTSTEPITVDYRTEDMDSATACGTSPCDYNRIYNNQLIFEPGASVATLGVDIIDDNRWEASLETFQVVLRNISNAGEINVTTDIEIEDNDSAPSVAFAAEAATSNEGAGVMPITVTLQGQTDFTATVIMSTTGGTATPTDDYIPLYRPLTFTPGITSQVVSLTLIDDTLIEGTETITLALGKTQNARVGTPSTMMMQITDDEALPTAAFGNGATSVDETAGSAPITVTLSEPGTVTATVVVSTTGGTATPGADYTAIRRTLVFTPGLTLQVLRLPIVDDGRTEEDETVKLALDAATNANISQSLTTTLTILDSGATVYLPLVLRSGP